MKMTSDAAHMPAWERWLLAAFVLLVIGLRIYNAPGYPYHEDEAGSISILRSIVETGMPLAENGTLYWRSLLGHYLMAIPLYFTEVSPVSTRLVCILFSGMVLPVVYAMGRHAGGSMAGWLAVLFLGFSAFENLFASMARFYMPFQFFFVAAVFFAGEYFIRRRAGAGLWLLLSTVGAIGTHSFAVELLLVFFLAALIGRDPEIFRRRSFWLGSLLVFVVGYLSLFFLPLNAFVNYVAIPLNIFALDDKLAFWGWFRQLTPLGITLLIGGLYPLLAEQRKINVFYLMSFVYCLAALSIVAPGDNPRYMNNLYPIGLVACCFSLTWWIGQFMISARGGKSVVLRRPLVLGFVLVVALGYFYWGDNKDLSSAFGTYFRFVDQKPAHDIIQQRLLPTDMIVSTEPGLTELYLGRPVEFFLREKYNPDSDTYERFSQVEKKTLTMGFIDSPEMLLELLESTDRRIWFYTNWKITSTVSVSMDETIKRLFRPVFSRNETYVLVRP